MSCQEYRIEILARLTQGLDPEGDAHLAVHLGQCPHCARFYREQIEIDRLLEPVLATEPDPPERIWAALEARLTPVRPLSWRESMRNLFGQPALRMAAAAAGVLLLLSIQLFDLGVAPLPEERILAELEAYHLETQGNPFHTFDFAPEDSNPFLNLAQPRENPFARFGGTQ